MVVGGRRADHPVESAAHHAGRKREWSHRRSPTLHREAVCEEGRAAEEIASEEGAAAKDAAPASAPARKSSTSRKPAATKARATKAAPTTRIVGGHDARPPRNQPPRRRPPRHQPPEDERQESAGQEGSCGGSGEERGHEDGGAKADADKPPPRRVPKPPSPDTPALLSNYRPDRHEIPEPRGIQGRHRLHEGLRRQVPEGPA